MPVAQYRERVRVDRGRAAVVAEHREPEPRAQDRASLADPPEEAEVLGEAAERDVLAVVGRRLRVALPPRQGLHRASEGRPRLVERHLVPGVRELEGRTQPREPSSYDGDPHLRSAAPKVRSFVSGESRSEPSKTSNP